MDYIVNGMLIEMVDEDETRKAEEEQLRRLMPCLVGIRKEDENNDSNDNE